MQVCVRNSYRKPPQDYPWSFVRELNTSHMSKLDQLLKKSPPSTSHAGFNQAITLIWSFVIEVAQVIVALVQSTLVHTVMLVQSATALMKPASASIKCAKCLAKGHQASACRSKNPTAVRRRISANNKHRGRVAALPCYMNLPAQPHLLPFMPPQELAHLADAAELRQWQAQSKRDRKHWAQKSSNLPAPAKPSTSKKK
ncbi:hypothetical protein BU17DRAFT_83244 [Hysterangium stoloniferum]|nr:hypothetical protein BU17DRAFT_83244 [Hysterangium stoloniferum]